MDFSCIKAQQYIYSGINISGFFQEQFCKIL